MDAHRGVYYLCGIYLHFDVIVYIFYFMFVITRLNTVLSVSCQSHLAWCIKFFRAIQWNNIYTHSLIHQYCMYNAYIIRFIYHVLGYVVCICWMLTVVIVVCTLVCFQPVVKVSLQVYTVINLYICCWGMRRIYKNLHNSSHSCQFANFHHCKVAGYQGSSTHILPNKK